MPQQRIQTGSTFEFDSFWQVASDDEGPEDAQGRLTYDPDGGVELTVVDLRQEGAGVFDGPKEIPVLHGHDLQGKPCTLFDVVPVETQGGFGGHVREVLHSNRLVYGAQLDSMEELEIDHVTVDLWGLTEWVNGIWATGEGGVPVKAASRLARLSARLGAPWARRRKETASAELPEGESLNVPLDGAHLVVQRGIANRDGRRAQNKREAHVTARFELDEATTYHDFSERFIRPLQDLMVLSTHLQVEVDAITVLTPYEEEKWWGDQKPIRGLADIAIIERTRFDRPSSPMTTAVQLPMPLRAWGGAAPIIIARWFKLRHELGGPANLLFATLNKRNSSLEADVLNLLSVAEGYHRRGIDEPPFSDEAHQEVVSLIRGIGDKARRDHYIARLRHANQQSQKQRVRALFERAEQVLPEAESWRRNQLQPLIDTRNFLTHWGDPTDEVLEGWDLWYALNRVRVVLEVNLYLDLGVDHETITRAMRIGYHGREFMGPA
jgi:hypothetical protein